LLPLAAKINENQYTLLFRSLRDAALTAMPRPGRDVRRDGSVGGLKVRSRLIDASRPRHAAVARLFRQRLFARGIRESLPAAASASVLHVQVRRRSGTCRSVAKES